MSPERWTRWRDAFRHAFALGEPEQLSDAERRVLERVAAMVIARQMQAAATVFLESCRPLNFVAGQALVFFLPIVKAFLNTTDFDTLTAALQKRTSIDYLLDALEQPERT